MYFIIQTYISKRAASIKYFKAYLTNIFYLLNNNNISIRNSIEG